MHVGGRHCRCQSVFDGSEVSDVENVTTGPLSLGDVHTGVPPKKLLLLHCQQENSLNNIHGGGMKSCAVVPHRELCSQSQDEAVMTGDNSNQNTD